jgi:6-phosphogluconolactonase
MRFSPIKFLHGLLYTAPVLFLTLAACGGGGGSTPGGSLAASYILSVNVTGVSGVGVVLRNNGGNDLTVTTPGTYPFTTAVVAGSGYDVTVLSNPSSPVQVCTVTSAMPATMPASNVTVGVNCVNAYKIGGTINGDPSIAVSGIGPILHNNNGEDLFIDILPASGVSRTFTFNIPVASGVSYAVTQLSKAKSPGQDCSGGITNGTGTVSGADITNVSITCVSVPTVPKYAYVTNSTANTVSPYAINATSGVLTAGTALTTGTQPYSVSVDPTGRFAYVANHSSNNISAYSIDGAGALSAIDANGAVSGYQATIAAGTYPISVTVHPSGKFAYVVNESSADISVYSIDSTTGALSAIDANGALGTQASIATGLTPYAVTIDPTGYFAYVANYGNVTNPAGTISEYAINQTSGALTSIGTVTAGAGASSIAIDPTSKFAVVTNQVAENVMSFTITSGALTPADMKPLTGSSPRSVAINPNTGGYAYVANANSGDVSAFSISNIGILTPILCGSGAGCNTNNNFLAGTTPVSVNVDPSGQFVYVANFSSNNVSTYTIGGGGALTSVGTAATGTGPTSVTTTQ